MGNILKQNLIAWCCAVLAITLISVTVSYSQNVLSGRVFNVSQDSASVSGISVKLQLIMAGGHAHLAIDSTITDRLGQFSFRNIEADSNATYFPIVDYNATRYFGEPINFFMQNERKESNVAVYDTTHSDKDLVSSMHHVFVEMNAEIAMVREILIMNNLGSYSILETPPERGIDGATIVFSLPHNAGAVQPLSGFTQDAFVFRNGKLYDYEIMAPGTKQVTYAYNLPVVNGMVTIHRLLDYDTNLFDLFISDPNLQIDYPSLEPMGPFTIRNTVYQRYGKQNALRGEDIVLTLRGVYGQNAPSVTPVIFITVFFLIAGIVFLKVGKKKKGVVTNQSQKAFKEEKRRLVSKIAQLDDQLAQQEISEQKHTEERAVLMDSLLFVERELVAARLKSKGGRKK